MSLALGFAPLMTGKGFSNQEAFLGEMFKGLVQADGEEPDISRANVFDELFNFGSFDDATGELDDFHQMLVDNKNKTYSEESGDLDLDYSEYMEFNHSNSFN